MKGAATGETNIWNIRLQLMKPITWIPLIWDVVCGAASSGNFTWSVENVFTAAACVLLSGPFMTGYTQTINDFYDREIVTPEAVGWTNSSDFYKVPSM